jgi:hypothetical protein
VTATFDKVADIIAETSEIDRDSITPESHTIDDLGIDSLDFSTSCLLSTRNSASRFRLSSGLRKSMTARLRRKNTFVLGNLCTKIDELRAAKG